MMNEVSTSCGKHRSWCEADNFGNGSILWLDLYKCKVLLFFFVWQRSFLSSFAKTLKSSIILNNWGSISCLKSFKLLICLYLIFLQFTIELELWFTKYNYIVIRKKNSPCILISQKVFNSLLNQIKIVFKIW